MKHKVGMESGGGNKKRKEVGNESPLQLGLDEAAHVEPAPARKRNLAHPIVGSDTVDATVDTSSYNSGCNSAKTQCVPELNNNFKSASPLSNRLVPKKAMKKKGMRKIEVEVMFCTWCEVSHKNKT
jgi:hypothetical protein